MIPLKDDNPSELTPVVTFGLILACTVVFLWELHHGRHGTQRLAYSYGLIPSVLLGLKSLPSRLAVIPPQATLFTSMFLHGGWLHLIGNMLYLWIFGDNVEDAMGHGRFLFFYLLCGVIAALAQALPDPHSTVPMIGASGAISGVLGAYLVLFPRAQVRVLVLLGIFVTTARLQASLMLILWFALQFLSDYLAPPGAGGGVAFRAHIGGFVAGILLVMLFKRRGFRSATSS